MEPSSPLARIDPAAQSRTPALEAAAWPRPSIRVVKEAGKFWLHHHLVLTQVRLVRNGGLRAALAVLDCFQSCEALENVEQETAGIDSRLVLFFIRAVGHRG